MLAWVSRRLATRRRFFSTRSMSASIVSTRTRTSAGAASACSRAWRAAARPRPRGRGRRRRPGLAERRDGRLEGPVDRPLGLQAAAAALVDGPPGEGPAQEDQPGERQAQCGLHPPALGLLGGAGLGGGPVALGGPQPLLHAGQVGRDPLGHGRGVARPVLGLGRQAVAGQGDQLGLGTAGVQPGQGVGRLAPRRLADDLAGGPAGEGRRAGEDLAEDRAQREDVGPLVDHLGLAPGLLGGHVAGRAQDRPGVRQVGVRPAPRRGDHRLRGRLLARLRVGGDAPALAGPWPGPSPSPGPRRRSRPSRSTASGRGGSRPARGRRPSSGRSPRRSTGTGAGRRRGRPRRQEIGQGLPLDQLHAEERPPVGERAQLVDRHDARGAGAGRRSAPPRRTGGPCRRCRGSPRGAP